MISVVPPPSRNQINDKKLFACLTDIFYVKIDDEYENAILNKLVQETLAKLCNGIICSMDNLLLDESAIIAELEFIYLLDFSERTRPGNYCQPVL